MGHINEQRRAYFVGDFPHDTEVDQSRVGRVPTDEDERPELTRLLAQGVIVNQASGGVSSITCLVEHLARNVWPEHRIMELVRTSPYVQCHTQHTYWILLRYGTRYTFVAEGQGTDIVGYASGVRSTVEPKTFFIWQVVVTPLYRQHGVGAALVASLTEQAESDGCLEFHTAIAPNNQPAIRLIEGWAARTGRVSEVGEQIAYTAAKETPGNFEEVTEDLIFIRSSTTKLTRRPG
jgi:GNAT superfamily N-acetyltransferase